MKIIIDLRSTSSATSGDDIDEITEIVHMLRSHAMLKSITKEIYVDDDGGKITVGERVE